jgi:hypothetical protein
VPPTLDGCRLKLERSLELLEKIRAGYDEESAKKLDPSFAQRIVGEVNPIDGFWWVDYCEAITRPVPVRWGMLAGDAMHNARTSLDHLACQLVELADNTPTNANAFPIWDRKPKGRKDRQRYRRRVAGMSPAHAKGIWKLQPFHDLASPNSAKLVALAALDNLDKHQTIIPLLAVVSDNPPDVQFQSRDLLIEEVEWRWNKGAAIRPGVEIIRWRSRLDHRRPIDLTGGIRLRATYGDASTGLRELREIRSYCVGIVESFAPDFP